MDDQVKKKMNKYKNIIFFIIDQAKHKRTPECQEAADLDSKARARKAEQLKSFAGNAQKTKV